MSHMISKLWFALALIGADPEQSGACFEKFRPLVGEKMMIFSPTSWGTSPEADRLKIERKSAGFSTRWEIKILLPICSYLAAGKA